MVEVCKEAMLLASLLLINDKAFAARIGDLISRKNIWEARKDTGLYKDKEINEHLFTINNTIDTIVEAKLLATQGKFSSLGGEARAKLASQIEEAGWDFNQVFQVLDAMISINPKNVDELALLLSDGNIEEGTELLERFKQKYSEYVIAKEKMRLQGIKDDLSKKIANTEKKHMNAKGKKGGGTVEKTLKETKTSSTIKETKEVKSEVDNGPSVEQPSLFGKDDIRYRRDNALIDNYSTLPDEEARKIVYKYFDSDEVTVIFSGNLTGPWGQRVFGMYKDKMISFAKNPIKGTPEHEVVHAYMDLFLSEIEKREVLDEIMNTDWVAVKMYMDDFGLTASEAAEEVIADKFIDYVKKRKTITGRLGMLFETLWNRVRKLLTGQDSVSKVNSLYRDIIKKRRPKPKQFGGTSTLGKTKWDGKTLFKEFDFSDAEGMREFNDSMLGGVGRNVTEPYKDGTDWGNEAERQITETLLAYDTNIDWGNLVVSVDGDIYLNEWATPLNEGMGVAGHYMPRLDHIIVGVGGETVPHEMQHALDYLWYKELFGLRGKASMDSLASIPGWFQQWETYLLKRNPKLTERELSTKMKSIIYGYFFDNKTRLSLMDELYDIHREVKKGLYSTQKGTDWANKRMADKTLNKEYWESYEERWARFGQTFVQWVKSGKVENYFRENFDEGTFEKFRDWLSHMADARSKGQLHTPGRVMTKDIDPMYKRAGKDYVPISDEEVRERVYRYFDPDEVPVEFVDNITTPEGQIAMGLYYDGMIRFVKNPDKYTPDHEVVHAYMDLFLSETEKREILSYVTMEQVGEIGAWIKKNGLDTTDMENWRIGAEEIIADGFVNYVRNSETFTGRLKDLFQEIWYRIKKVFGNEDYVRTLYKDIKSKKRKPKTVSGTKKLNNTKWDGKKAIDNYNKMFKSADDVKQFNDEHLGGVFRNKDNPEYDEIVAKTILGYDTNIDWTNLIIAYEPTMGQIGKTTLGVNGMYISNQNAVIAGIGKYTLPHEMTHSLDRLFYQEIFGHRINRPLTEEVLKGGYDWLPKEKRDLADEFLGILNDVIDATKDRSLITKLKRIGGQEYFDRVQEIYARFGEAFIKQQIDGKGVSYIGEKFSQELFDRYSTWLSHMAEARANGKLNSVGRLKKQNDEGFRFKRMQTDTKESITQQSIKSDPFLQAEYSSRIDAVKQIQQMVNEDIETLKNFGGFFGTDDGLFGTTLVKDAGDTLYGMARMYLKNGEDINTMTLSDLRRRMQSISDKYRYEHRPKNVIAWMEAQREENSKTLDLFDANDIKTEKGIDLKIDGRFTKEGLNAILRDSFEEDSVTSSTAKKVDTSKGKGDEKKGSKSKDKEEKLVAETWADLENGRNKVETQEDPNPDINDPINKTELSSEAEQILKENIEKDIEQVFKGESPSNVGSADDIWREFMEHSEDIVERERMLNNFILGKIFLGEGDDTLESALKWLDGKNLEDYGPLRLAQIAKITDLGQLEQVVYTHMGDIAYNKEIREALKDKQYELWTSATEGEAKVDSKVFSKARSMQKTAEFLEAGGTYTNVALYDRVGNALKQVFDIKSTESNRDIYDQFIAAVTNFSVKNGQYSAKVGGVPLDANDLVRGIYAISWNDLVKDVASLRVDPTDQLKVAAKKLFDIGDEKSAKNAQKRIDDLFNYATPDELRNADPTKIAYSTTSAVKVGDDMTSENTVFFNYRDALYGWDKQTTYGEFFDELVKQNSLIIDTEHTINEVFDVTSIPVGTKYIIVNDLDWRDNIELKRYIDGLKAEEKPVVVFPRGGKSNSYYIEGGTVKFKTTSMQFYKEVTMTATAKSMGAFAKNIIDQSPEVAENLEAKALEYFRVMMGLDSKGAPVDKAEYKAWVINNLRIMTGLPISSDADIYNPASTWKMASDIIRYQLGATGKYTKVIKNVEETVSDINYRFSNDRDNLFKEIIDIVGGNPEIMEKNADEVRNAYITYSTAPTIEAKIQAKGTLMALCNGGEYNQIDVNLFNAALRNDDFVSVLGPIIYGEREYTDKEVEALNALGDDILSAYIFDLGSNIIRNNGYDMPLVSPAQTIRKLLKGEDIMNDEFVQAFIKKNGLQQNGKLVEGILRDALPAELDISIDTSMLLDTSLTVPNIVVEEVPNVIIPTNYNQLLAVIRKSSGQGGITWEEEAIIKGILDNYYSAVEKAIESGIMTPTLAQQLKLQAGWALDMAEQDLILSKYDSYLTLEERNGIMGGKYKLRIATNKEELKELKEGNENVLNGYRNSLSEMGRKWIVSYSNLENAEKDLIEKGKIITNVDGKILTMNVNDLLIQQLETLPDGLRGIFDNFKNMTRNEIKNIPYKQAYALVKAIELAKNAAARGNLYARLMYKQNPQLANIAFFRRYILNSDGVPVAMQRNVAKLEDSSIDDGLDTMFKQNIMLDISQVMKKNGRITDKELDDIVLKELSSKAENEKIKNHYKNIFKAYTYLTDIPRDIKVSINQMLDVQLKEIRESLSKMDSDFVEGVLNSRLMLADGSEMMLRDVLAGNIDLYKQNLFIEKGKDGVYREIKARDFTSKELGLTDKEIRQLGDSMYSILNSIDEVTEIERKMNTVILGDARQILNKYTSTKKFIDTDYLIGGQNDLVKNLIKSNAFSNWGQLRGDQDLVSKARGRATGKSFFNKENWEAIKDYYYTYYRQPLDVLDKMMVSNDLQATALEMAKYFKRIENTLGSADGSMGASVNTALNRAFGRLGTIILRVNNSAGVNALMNAISNNQVLAFFKFAKEGDGAYFDLFSKIDNGNKTRGVEYVRDVELKDVKRFNELFNTNFSRGQYVIILQALGGYKIGGKRHQRINAIGRFINYSNSFLRMMMSYPYQLLTIAPQSIAYNFKSNGFKRDMGIEDMGKVNDIREYYDILTSEYVELNPSGWASSKIKNVLSRYGGKEVSDLIKKEGVEMDNSIIELFGKSYDHARKNYTWQQFVQLIDATRDNANNIIDALMAQKFKNLAFHRALKYNNVMSFENVDAFETFMKNDNIPQELKNKVLDAVKIYSGRVFKDMLGTGFSGLDKMYGANMAQDILIGLMNTINFRGAWGLNMTRQALGKIVSALKTIRFVGDKRARQQAVEYLMKTPEWKDFTSALFNDAVWMWKMARFSDNGKVPTDESEADLMDFCERILANIDMVSQQWQGIVSFGPVRPLLAMGEAIIKHQIDPEHYGDKYGTGALIRAFVSNFGRNRKPYTFVIKALVAAQSDGDMGRARGYISDHWYEISAGTLRFMVEEGYNDFGANTPLVYEIGGIPSIVRGQQWEGSDTAFMYMMKQAELSEYISKLRAGEEGYSGEELFGQLMSYSQFLSAIKETYKFGRYALGSEEYRESHKSSRSTYSLEDMDADYANVPEWKEWRETGFIRPKHDEGYMDYYDSIINVFTESSNPGGAKFIEGLENFNEYGHVNGEGEGSYFDAALEEFYTRIKEKDANALNDILWNETLLEQIDTEDTAGAIQTELSWAMKWLQEFDGDPEYNKYAAVIYKGVMSNVLYNELQDYADKETARKKANGQLPKKKDKVSASNLKKGPRYDQFKKEFVDRHFGELVDADSEGMQGAMFKFLVSKSSDISKKYFNYNEEYDRWYLKSNLKAQAQQLIDFEDAMNDGDWARAVVQGTQITKTFSYDHPVSSQVATYIFNRIKDSDTLPDDVKLEAMTEFVSNNLDAFAYDGEFAKDNPEVYEDVKRHYNELIYQVNQELISKANDYALSLSSDSDSKKKGGGGGLALKVKKLSSALRKKQTDGGQGGARGTGYTMTWLKAPIIDPTKIFIEDSKEPKINFTPKAYTPKTDLGGGQKQQPTAQPVKVKKVKVKEKDIEVI